MTLSSPNKIPSSKLDVDLIENWESFESIQQEYEQFISGELSTEVLPYQFEWMQCVRPLNIEAKIEPYFLVVRESETIVGFAPLMKETNPWSKGWFSRLRVWGEHTSPLCNTFLDFISLVGMEEVVIKSIRDYLFGDGKGDWDILEFSVYSETNTSFPYMKKYFPSGKWRDENTDCYSLTLPIEKDDLFAHLSSKRKKNMRRVERRLKEAYPDVVFNCHTELSEDLFSKISNLHSKRQQDLKAHGRDRNFLLENKIQRQVLWDLLKTAEKNHWLKLYTIENNDEIISFSINFQKSDMAIGFLMAFDGQYAKFAPSFLLVSHLIETEFDQKQIKEINFLPSKTEVKETFSNKTHRKLHFRQINDRNLMTGLRIVLWGIFLIPALVISKIR